MIVPSRISGSVDLLRWATITVVLVDSNGRERTVEVRLDTGFTGDMTLPASAIEQLGFPFISITGFRTGTGQFADFDTYRGNILWHGRERVINVLESETLPLIGVGLLWGNNLSIDFTHGGNVTVTELLET